MMRTLRVIQALVDLGDGIGVALVPYYRQLLPVLNIFIGDTSACTPMLDSGGRERGVNQSCSTTFRCHASRRRVSG